MRVLHLLKTAHGAAWALRQIRELVALGVDIHVALPEGGPMVGKYTAAGATEHLLQSDLPLRNPHKFGQVASALKQLVDRVRPDIIHSHFVGTTVMARLALGNRFPIPRVFQVPGPLHLEHPVFRSAEIASAGRQDYWIGSCKWTSDRYRASGIEAERVFLSYYGTDTNVYVPKEPGKIRNELGISADRKIVGLVAYMYAPKRYLMQRRGLKGHEDLIDAIEICLRTRSNIHCVIVGGPWGNAHWYEKQIRDYARETCGGHVTFLGTRTDVPEIYADLDVVVHPSHSENVGGAVESCLLRVPTIATRVGGFPDLIKDGSTGWLVRPKDPADLARSILDALDRPDEAIQRAIAGQQRALHMFDVKQTGAEVREIYQKIQAHYSRQAFQ